MKQRKLGVHLVSCFILHTILVLFLVNCSSSYSSNTYSLTGGSSTGPASALIRRIYKSPGSARGLLFRPLSSFQRKADVDRQGGGLASTLLAGPMFIALSTLLLSFPLLPLLMFAPLAFSGLAPAISSVNDAISGLSGTQSTLSQVLQTLAETTGNAGTSGSTAGSTSSSSSSSSGTGSLASAVSNAAGNLAASGSSPAASVSAPASSTVGAGGLSSLLTEGLGGGFMSQLASTAQALSSNTDNPNSLSNLATNTLNSISKILFNTKRSSPSFDHHRHQYSIPGENLFGHHQFDSFRRVSPDNSFSSSSIDNSINDSPLTTQKGNNPLAYFKDVYRTVRDGFKKYEISESECQSRLICELHQKAVKRSFRSWASMLMDLIGLETQLERSSVFDAKAKTHLKEFVRAAKTGMSDSECSIAYSKCPMSIAIEPLTNTILCKFFRQRSLNRRSFLGGLLSRYRPWLRSRE